MTDAFQEAPPAEAPKQAQNFLHFDPLPESGPVVMTLVATNYIPEYRDIDKTTGKERVYAAIELFFGTAIDRTNYFLKTWPMRYSINARSNWSKVVKAMTGALPEEGSKPKDFVGKAASITVENVNKTSKLGKAYTASRIAGYAQVPKVLITSITPVTELQAALEAKLKAQDESEPF